MLKKTKSTTLTGSSMIDGKEVFRFSARIESDNPANMNISYMQINKELHEANLATVRADQAQFEDYAFGVKKAMLAEMEGEKTDEESN